MRNVIGTAVTWLAAAGLLIGAALFSARSAEGMEITPAACFSFNAEYVSNRGLHSALILNTCTGELKWVKIPTPPESEV